MTKYSLSQECKPFSTFETISQWIYHINRIKDEDHRWSQKILRKNLIKSRQQNGCLRGLTNSCEKKRKVKMKSLSHVRLFATPWTVAYQAPPSIGFSRQEYWSGLPFPSPMHESEKWKWSRSVVSDSSRPHGLQPTRLLRPWGFPGKSTEVGCRCLKYELEYDISLPLSDLLHSV